MPLELEKISAARLNLLKPEQTVFFFPVGPIEDHGPHLPMGLDLLEAGRLATLAAERLEKELQGWTAVMMPALPLGIDSETTAIALTVRPHVLRDWLVDASLALSRHGFRHFVCFSGQLGPRQLTAIEEAGKIVRRKVGPNWLKRLLGNRRPAAALVSASSALTSVEDLKASAFWPDPVEHGGKRDTSLGLALAANQVDPMYQNLPPQSREATSLARTLKRFKRELSGYWGEPAGATAAAGNAVLSSEMERIFPKLHAVWLGANPNGLFRSWYSILPPNKSFFKSWVIFLVILAIFGMLVFINLASFDFPSY